VAGFPHLR